MTLLMLRLFFLILCVLGSWSISQLHDQWAEHPVLAILIGLAGGGAFYRRRQGAQGVFAARAVGGLVRHFGRVHRQLLHWQLGSVQIHRRGAETDRANRDVRGLLVPGDGDRLSRQG
jgi:hypothetical protein